MSSPTNVAVIGAAGRMGRAIIGVIAQTEGARLAVACERAGNSAIGKDAGALAGIAEAGVALSAGLPGAGAASVWIDFSLPETTVAHAQAAAEAGAALVIGTTGLSAQQKQAIAACARKVPIVLAPNMSVGINVLLKLVADATRILGTGYDVDIVEAHHRHKRDAPSGTALRLAEAVAEARGKPLDQIACYARHGDVGPRPAGEVGVQTLRGGDVVGDHTVFFFGDGERVEITHRASSRETFARGAVRAALWLTGKPAALYDMRDVLGLR